MSLSRVKHPDRRYAAYSAMMRKAIDMSKYCNILSSYKIISIFNWGDSLRPLDYAGRPPGGIRIWCVSGCQKVPSER